MSKGHHLRIDKTCLNCGDPVEKRFCSNCGQENTEPRQTFAHLIAHFIEDLTHYDGKFWGTLKYLFFRPAYLSKLYLAGKRSAFIPPVRLYIFASFITFLLPHILPEFDNHSEHKISEKTYVKLDTDTVPNMNTYSFYYNPDKGIVLKSHIRDIQQLDSLKEAQSHSDTSQMSYGEYIMFKKSIELRKYTPAEVQEKLIESLGKNFPKALFLYMPLFALVIRLFHKKKNWMYFDHAIFTLHYFSFLLLLFSSFLVVDAFNSGISSDDVYLAILTITYLMVLAWSFFYFMRAHRVMYAESWIASSIKALLIYALNLALFILLFIVLILLSMWMLH